MLQEKQAGERRGYAKVQRPWVKSWRRALLLLPGDAGAALGLSSGGVNVGQRASRVLCDWGVRVWEAEEGEETPSALSSDIAPLALIALGGN